MQTATRRQLKQDKFVKSTQEAVHWTVEHRNTLIVGGIVVLVAMAALFGGNWYLEQQDDKASLSLSEAIQTYYAQLRPADAPAIPGEPSYTSSTDRAKAAHDAFLKVANEYSSAKNGKFALYMAGVAAMDMGDNAAAEKHLKDAADKGDKELSAMAKFALANLYHQTQKDADAVRLYREVAAANTASVPALNAKLALGQMLEAKQPEEAIKVYEEVVKDAQASAEKPATNKKGGLSTTPAPAPPQTVAEQLATARLNELRNPKK